MNRIELYANHIIDSLNVNLDNIIEIVTPTECEEFAFVIKSILDRRLMHSIITYTNADDEFYLSRDANLYHELIRNKFSRITIYSSFVKPKNKYYIKDYSIFLKDYIYSNDFKRAMAVFPSVAWASKIGVEYSELLNRIIDISLMKNRFEEYILRLKSLNIKYARVKTSIGTDLSLEFTNFFTFNGSKFKTSEDIIYQPNIPSLEIFTSPIKYSLNGKIVGSKPIYINNHIINSFSLEFSDGRVINSSGLDSILSLSESLQYVGEFGISPYNSFVFYNTLLDENTATHIAIGNSYYMGIIKEEQDKLNVSKYHIDLPIGTDDMVIEFYDINNNLVCIFKDNDFNFGG